MPVHKTYTEEEKRAAIAAVDARGDRHKKDVMKELGVHDSMINRWRQQLAGVSKPKKAPGNKKGTSKATLDMRRDKAIQMVAGGARPSEVAKKIGVTEAAVYSWTRHIRNGAAKPNGHAKPDRDVKAAIQLLRGVKGKINVDDPVHLVAMVVLNTLEGKM